MDRLRRTRAYWMVLRLPLTLLRPPPSLLRQVIQAVLPGQQHRLLTHCSTFSVTLCQQLSLPLHRALLHRPPSLAAAAYLIWTGTMRRRRRLLQLRCRLRRRLCALKMISLPCSLHHNLTSRRQATVFLAHLRRPRHKRLPARTLSARPSQHHLLRTFSTRKMCGTLPPGPNLPHLQTTLLPTYGAVSNRVHNIPDTTCITKVSCYVTCEHIRWLASTLPRWARWVPSRLTALKALRN